jgi:hypothetical protein
MQLGGNAMTADEWTAYLKEVQNNSVIDAASLTQYSGLVDGLGGTVRKAADALMQFEDEAAHFLRLLRERRR